MSIFSGKCDFYDSIIMIKNDGDEDKVTQYCKQCEFYIIHNDRRLKLNLNSYEDCIPYFPFLVCLSYHSSDYSVYVLSSKSFVDSDEEEHLSFILNDALREYKKCKRNHIEYSADAYFKSYWRHDDITKEIFYRVEKYGTKATIEDLHSPLKDKWDRKALAEEMLSHGYSEQYINNWVYAGRPILNNGEFPF